MRSTRNGAKVTVIGGGHVGLPTAVVLAHFGHEVVLAESDPARFEMLLRGESPIVETGVEKLLSDGLRLGTLRIAHTADEAVREAEFVFLCVPTPQGSDGSADLTFVEAVAEEIKTSLRPGAIIVNKSTVPVGTAALVERMTQQAGIRVVSNPEFLREGSAIADSLHPDRIVVGADDPADAQKVGQLFAATGAPVIVTDTTTAEAIKYASNAYLATKLSFVNALADLCETVGANVDDLMAGVGHDQRIGFEFLHPGPGWGGSCLPKDTSALLHRAEVVGHDFALLRGAIAQNEDHMDRVVQKIARLSGGTLEGALIAVWGLTFKAGTDDRRSSPATAITRRLVRAGSHVSAYDPTVPRNAGEPDLAGITIVPNPYEACRGAHVVALLTEWGEFASLNFTKVAALMDTPAVFDARNILDPTALRRLGFSYAGIGRP
jgi:UDPglucose 6-dehydrogenase